MELKLNRYSEGTERYREDISRSIHLAFSAQVGLRVTDYASEGVSSETLAEDMLLLRSALSARRVTEGFNGLDNKTTRRRSFCALHELGRPAPDPDYMESQLPVTDTDPKALLHGMEVVSERPDLAAAIGRFNLVTDRVISAVMDAIRRACAIPEDYFHKIVLPGSTCRLRAVYYGKDTANSACGIHPDANILSLLFTDRSGFRYFDRHLRVHEPDPGDPILLPGSLLYRWSGGLYQPVFHYVRNMSEESKTSLAYFYNLRRLGQFTTIPYQKTNPVYINDVWHYKFEDIRRDGPFGDLFSELMRRASYELDTVT
jgi:hypothetical protein